LKLLHTPQVEHPFLSWSSFALGSLLLLAIQPIAAAETINSAPLANPSSTSVPTPIETPPSIPPEVPTPAQSNTSSETPLTSSEKSWNHEFMMTRSYLAGVSNRLLVEYYGNYQLGSLFSLQVGNRYSLFEQWGLSLLGISGIFHLPWIWSDLTLGLEHERWEDWRTTENRAIVYWTFHPHSKIDLLFGVAYRAPQFGVTQLFQSLGWSGINPEVALIYRFKFPIFSIHNLDFSVLAWNYDHMRLFTYDNFHFSILAVLSLSSQLKVSGMATTAASGVSGGVVSWQENMFSLGIQYAP
jgi:hypothetical protein